MISGLRPSRSESQPATSGVGTEKTMSTPYISATSPLVQAEDLGQVEQDEQVHHAEPAAAAAEDRGEVEPEQVAVVGDPPERRPDAAARDGRGPVGAGLADEQRGSRSR